MRGLSLALAVAALLAGSAVPASSDATEIVILTIGDSITAGATGTTREGEGYRAELGRLLNTAGVPHRFVIAAAPGMGCGYWVSRAADLVETERPNIVLLNCGTNDAPGPQFETDYHQLLQALLSGNGWSTRVIPAWISYSAPPSAPAWLRDSEPAINDAIYRVVVGSIWQQEGRIPAIADMQSLPEMYLDSGGVHPTPAGYTVMARLWYQALRWAMPTLPDISPVTCGLTGHRLGYGPPPYVPCTTLAGV